MENEKKYNAQKKRIIALMAALPIALITAIVATVVSRGSLAFLIIALPFPLVMTLNIYTAVLICRTPKGQRCGADFLFSGDRTRHANDNAVYMHPQAHGNAVYMHQQAHENAMRMHQQAHEEAMRMHEQAREDAVRMHEQAHMQAFDDGARMFQQAMDNGAQLFEMNSMPPMGF